MQISWDQNPGYQSFNLIAMEKIKKSFFKTSYGNAIVKA
jgi:hypothetical protein